MIAKELGTRVFTIKDCPSVLEIYNKNYGRHYLFKDLDSLSKLIEDNAQSRVITIGDKVIGAYHISFNPEQHTCSLGGLVLDPDYHSKGLIGKNLLFKKYPAFEEHVKSLYDYDLLLGGARAYSRTSNFVAEFANTSLSGFFPQAHNVKGELEPGYYYSHINKKTKKRVVAGLIPEAMSLQKLILKNYRSKNSLDELTIVKEPDLSKLETNRSSYNTVDKAGYVNTIGLSREGINALVNKLLKKKPSMIIASAHLIDEQRTLYNRGFKPVCFLPYYFRVGDERLDTLQMMLILEQPDYDKINSVIKKIYNNSPRRRRLAGKVIEQFT